MTSPSVSLIIATYNWESALKLVLRSVATQRQLPDEVIVADDGSGVATRELVATFQADFPVPLIHAWQEDLGFRLARSRNNAVSQSRGEYLIFIDGDMILHRDFVKDHMRLASVDHFTVGSRVLLHEEMSRIAQSRDFFKYSWLKIGADNKLNAINSRLLSYGYAKSVREPISKWIFKVRGCNMGVWRSDYEAVNGFNHEFNGWGREDSEFALRLFNKGLSMRRLKFSAIQYHLYHPENDRERLLCNDEILQQSLHATSFRCDNGLSEIE